MTNNTDLTDRLHKLRQLHLEMRSELPPEIIQNTKAVIFVQDGRVEVFGVWDVDVAAEQLYEAIRPALVEFWGIPEGIEP